MKDRFDGFVFLLVFLLAMVLFAFAAIGIARHAKRVGAVDSLTVHRVDGGSCVAVYRSSRGIAMVEVSCPRVEENPPCLKL